MTTGSRPRSLEPHCSRPHAQNGLRLLRSATGQRHGSEREWVAPLTSVEVRATETSSPPSLALAAKLRSSRVPAAGRRAPDLRGHPGGDVDRQRGADGRWSARGVRCRRPLAPSGASRPGADGTPQVADDHPGARLQHRAGRRDPARLRVSPADRPTLTPPEPPASADARLRPLCRDAAGARAVAGYSGPDSHSIGYLFIQLATLAGVALAAAYVLRGRTPCAVRRGRHPGRADRGDPRHRGATLRRHRGQRTSWTSPMPLPASWGRSAIPTTSACFWRRRSRPASRRSWSSGRGQRRLLLVAVAIVLGIAFSIALSTRRPPRARCRGPRPRVHAEPASRASWQSGPSCSSRSSCIRCSSSGA